jgi:hypothetical protein
MCLNHRVSRRRAFEVAALTVAAALAGVRAARAAGPYDGPLVDVHCHLKAGLSPSAEEIVALLDGAGVRGAWLFGEPWQAASDARGRFPGQIVPFLAEGYANALHPHSSYANAEGLTQLLEARVVRGLGEVILRHSPYQLGAAGGFASAPANHVPADHPALVEGYRVAGRFGVPVNVHQEWFFAQELERALRAAPDTTFVWAHAGHGPPEAVRPMLERNPNLMADLSARTPWIGPGTVLPRSNGTLDPAWASTLTDLADRFVIGLDLFAPAHYQAGYVNQMAGYYRGLLGQLDPRVAAMIGHANAERVAPFAG